MTSKSIRALLAASLLTTTAAAPVAADNLGAALVGGLIGGAILNEVHKNKRRTTVTANSGTRIRNRETQTALNYFGFPAGTPDGVFGSRSRAAAAQYQVFMGYPSTGNLTQYERDFLVSSYSRAQVGGPQVIKAMQNPAGVRTVLHIWRDEANGTRSASSGYGYAGLPIEVSNAIDEIAASAEPTAEQLLQRSGFMQLADMNGDGKNDYMIDTSVSGSSFWCGASHCSVMVFVSTPQGYQRNDFMARDVTTADFSCHQSVCRLSEAPTTLAAAPAAPPVAAPVPVAAPTAPVMASGQATSGGALGGIQLFEAPAAATPSLTSHCSKISLLTNTNGGFVTAASMTDPDLALGEQFCLARSYAINRGETAVAGIQGVSQSQVDAQCDQFGPAVRPFLANLGTTDPAVVIGDVQKFILQSNMSVDQLKTTASICLFSGYRRDSMDVALGAALLLVGLGEQPYAELVGHHMALGFGAPVKLNRAQGWYTLATNALDNGAEPVFAPGQPERVALIKAASNGLTGSNIPAPVQASTGGAALPVFGSSD